ncbi:MAG TPA: hypothetical protein VK647_05550 [Gemmatimonadales bacterium]|jgi:hypothetical protein|nr:hypothetical protein [Gemmatimonadales bacterium]
MRRWSAVVPLVLMAACASVGGIRNAAPEAGKARWFDTSAVELVDVARKVLASTHHKIREQKQESDTTWYIIATLGSRVGDFLGWGSPYGYMIVRIRLVGRPDSTQVWVHTREDLVNILPGIWSGMIFKRIGRELCRRRVRAGQPSAKTSACSKPPEDRCPWPPSPLLNHTEANQCSDSASSTQSSRPQRPAHLRNLSAIR